MAAVFLIYHWPSIKIAQFVGKGMQLKFGEQKNGPAIIFSEEVLNKMAKYKQLNPSDKEAGGQLFANFKGPDTYIVEATPPKFLDKRGRTFFRANKFLQKLEIKAQYKLGNHYVGDWHTHPELHPTKSTVDLDSIQDCFIRSRHGLKSLVLAILGTADVPDGIVVYLANGNVLERLKNI